MTLDNVFEYSSIAVESVALGASGFGFRTDEYCVWISVVLLVGKCVDRIPSIAESVVGAALRSD